MAFHHRLDFAQVIGLQRGAGGDQVADEIGATQSRRDLDGAGQSHDVSLDVPLAQIPSRACTDRSSRCACRAASWGPRSDTLPEPRATGGNGRNRGCGSAESARLAARRKLQAFLLENVESDQPEIADVLLHQIGNVVVADEQHIQRHVLAVTHQLILAARQLQAAAGQHVERRIGEPPGFLYGQFQSHFIHGGHLRAFAAGSRLASSSRCAATS